LLGAAAAAAGLAPMAQELGDAPENTRREGLIAYVRQTPKPTRNGLAKFLDVPAQRFSPAQSLYDQYALDIYTMHADGSGRRALTTDGMNTRPRWSWDGAWIAYVNGPRPVENLYVVRADGTERRQLLERESGIVSYWWSLDSRSLLVAVQSRRGNNVLEGRVIDIAAGKTSRLTNSDWMRGWNHWEPGRDEVVNPHPRLLQALGDDLAAIWSPDAQFVAFLQDGFLALAHVRSVVDSGRWFLFQNEPPADRIFDWSWDGTKVLFQVQGRPAVAELAEGRWQDVYAVSTRRAAHAAFNADGSRVVFTAAPAGKTNLEIFIADARGEHETQVTNSAADHLDVHWQPVPLREDDTAPAE
jgi:Tol biopolymer transport system component